MIHLDRYDQPLLDARLRSDEPLSVDERAHAALLYGELARAHDHLATLARTATQAQHHARNAAVARGAWTLLQDAVALLDPVRGRQTHA